MNTKQEKPRKIRITASDKIGRSESITLMLDKPVAERLKAAAARTKPDGINDSELSIELRDMYEANKGQGSSYYAHSLSKGQLMRMRDFYVRIYNTLYNYRLEIEDLTK